MKKSLLFNGLFFVLLAFCWQSNLFANNEIYSGLELFKPEAFTEANLASPSVACDVPTWPTTSNITQTSATFSWDYISGAQSYSVQTRLPNGTWMSIPNNPVWGTSITVNGFNPNTTYEWRVRSNCSGGQYSSWTYPTSFTTVGSWGYCNAPNWLYTSNITQTSATWDWDDVNGCSSYTVQWRYPGGSWYNLPGCPVFNSWVNVSGLQPCTSYEWRVRSNCPNGSYSQWSYSASFTTQCYSCNAPYWTNTTNITQNSATFNWETCSGAQSYTVQIRLLNGTWYNITGCPYYGTWATVNGLDPNTTYQWRVRANCGGGQYSQWSSTNTFTTLGSYNYCEAPYWLYTTGVTQTAATFDWSPVNGAQSYAVEYRVAGGTWYTLYGSPFYDTWASISNLQPGTTYEWRVRSNCTNWSYSQWSSIVSFTTLNYSCSTPSWTYTNNITQNSATLSWSLVYGAQNYSVQTRLPNGTWYDIPGGPVNGTSVTIYNLNPSTTYEWRVRSNCGNWQYSNWTWPTSFTTTGGSCNAPSWLYTTSITQTSATLDWAPVSGAQSYSIQWRYPGGAWYDLPGGPWTETWYNWTGLQPGTTYEWHVRANCGYGSYSYWSSTTWFTTLAGYSCNTPTWPITSNITQTSATFSWDWVSGAQSYTVQTRLPNGTWYDLPGGPISNTSVTINGLNPNTTYEWRVRANCGSGQYSNWTSPVSFTTYGASCNAPAWLFTTNITQTAATLNWDLVNGALSYSLQYRLAGGTWYDVPGGPWTGSWHTINGLQPGTNYEWRVRSNCSNGNSSVWSYAEPFTTLGSTCNTPSWTSTTNITETSATFNWGVVYGAQNYTVQTRTPNGTWYDVAGGPFSNTYVTVYGFDPNTTYQWRVRANCGNGQYSPWTYPTNFTTNGGNSGATNDNCIDAITLTVNSTCQNTPGTNVGATPSIPVPSGECWSWGYKDVWFKFTMPNVSNPTVTIRTTAGSMYDAVMEVYVGTSCSNLSFLSCEDDNSNGNGSPMPVINLIGYQNAQIWVRLWGYGGSTGTFSICVLDYQSNNFVGEANSTNEPVSGEELGMPVSKVIEVSADHSTTPVAHVSPNPASDVLNVSLLQTDDCMVSGLVMTDLSGKVMMRKTYQSKGANEFRDELNVAGWTPGIYVLQIITTTGIITEKVSVITN
ncbi:MAG: fibronectin type III domain-containing protein [Saprospiraceae bacterium]